MMVWTYYNYNNSNVTSTSLLLVFNFLFKITTINEFSERSKKAKTIDKTGKSPTLCAKKRMKCNFFLIYFVKSVVDIPIITILRH